VRAGAITRDIGCRPGGLPTTGREHRMSLTLESRHDAGAWPG